MTPKNILVVRFRQMGDTILATAMLNSLRASYPEARIDLVLNQRLAPLFDGHPAISHVITFTDDERHHAATYLRKVWQVVHSVRYDVIIDMRSTMNTLPFSLFSLRTPFRIGLRKSYTHLVFNHRIAPCGATECVIDHDLRFLEPLPSVRLSRDITLAVTADEKARFGQYLRSRGLSMQRPILLAGVTTKLTDKRWPLDRMAEVLRRMLAARPDVQVIFNYAPGREEADARSLWEQLGRPRQVFIDVQARSSRELAAMCSFCAFYFGNEGGARHIAQAMGCPSLVVCSPGARKANWLPQGLRVAAEGIAPSDLASPAELSAMSYAQQYELITVEAVWQRLRPWVEGL